MIGSTIDNRYVVKNKIGEGGMSRVYLVYDNRLCKRWAMKCIEVSDITIGMSEASVLRNLDHPLLPRVVDVGNYESGHKSYIYIVMDYIEGRNLEELLREDGNISEDTCALWSLELLDALDYLHSQSPPIIYRDMKPSNVMVTSDGKLKIIDFGIAREKKEGNSSDTVALGTRGYAAPEQFGGRGQSDERTDIYCLGATMYHLITGKNPCEPPYRMYPVRHIKPSLSEGIEKVIMVATSSDPRKRYKSCQAMMDAIRNRGIYGGNFRRTARLFMANVFMAAGLLLILFAFPLKIIEKKELANSYDEYLKRSKDASVYSDRQTLLLAAIEQNPSRKEGYEYLIDLFAEDEIFNESEELFLLNVWDTFGEKGLSKEDNESISYKVGMLYWLFYSYGRDSELNIKQSVSWFQKAALTGDGPYMDMANVYYLVGLFQRDIASKPDIEGDAYLEYFINLESLLNIIDKNEYMNEAKQLETAHWIEGTLQCYYMDFIEAGVTESRIEEMLIKIRKIDENI